MGSSRWTSGALLLALALTGCARSPYYVTDPTPLRSGAELECPPGTISVCFERGGELLNCRCETADELGTIR